MTTGRPAPDDPLPGRIALVGLGLIGGSIARALRARGRSPELVAWSPAGRGPRAALAGGVIDRVAERAQDALDGAGLVILAGPPLATLELLEREPGPLDRAVVDGAIVTDVASTKAAIVAAADRSGLPFVGGHPMAGREASGFGAASADLFENRPWVVAPAAAARERDVAVVEALAGALGARPVRMTPAEHDAAVAAVSHLPLVAAAALVEAVAGGPDWPAARELAAGGWSSMTRLARGDVEMGAGILATNRDAVAERLRAYRDALDGWIAALEDAETDELRARLEAARSALQPSGGDA